jgi:hypothetical protein
MKPHDQKTGTKQEQKRRGKPNSDKKSNQKRRKCNKTISQKKQRDGTWYNNIIIYIPRGSYMGT